MIKHFLTGIFTTLAISSIVSMSAMASEINDTVKIDNSGKVTLISETIADNNVNTLCLTLEADTDKIQNVSFSFDTANNIKISEYRYNSERKQLNIYLSGTDPIFEDNTLEIGTVSAKDESGKDIVFSTQKASLQYILHNEIIENEINEISVAAPPTTIITEPVETTTTPVTTTEPVETTTTPVNALSRVQCTPKPVKK
ncbi:MAG: hypothetical protein K2O29_00280, partial [Ruminococcus sp.]|nr:hypothetical protein [Ruminococcus sp.]